MWIQTETGELINADRMDTVQIEPSFKRGCYEITGSINGHKYLLQLITESAVDDEGECSDLDDWLSFLNGEEE